MEVTYHKGPEGIEYCKIKTNREEIVYNIDGLPKRNCDNQSERKDLLLQIIGRNNGKILHTHVIILAQRFGDIAKRTIEKELENLKKDGFLESEKNGNSPNGVRKWAIKSPESDIEKYAKSHARNILKELEHYVSTIEKEYDKFNSVKKAMAMTYLLQIIYHWQPIIEIINQETKIKNEKKEFDSLIRRTYDILRHEKRDHVDGRPILIRYLDLRASIPYMEIRKFLEEI